MENLRALRRQAGLTLKELGAALGLAESTVSLYENDKRNPDVQTLIRFADYFSVSVDFLLGREDKSSWTSSGFSAHEKDIIYSYRSQPQSVQNAICDILHIEHPALLKAN